MDKKKKKKRVTFLNNDQIYSVEIDPEERIDVHLRNKLKFQYRIYIIGKVLELVLKSKLRKQQDLSKEIK